MRNPNDLKVFQKARDLALAVYQLTIRFPGEERFELVRQIRRAAVSIPSNLAEGCSRQSQADFSRFVEIALGSSMELECQLSLAIELALRRVLIDRECLLAEVEFAALIRPVWQQAAEISKMLLHFQKALRAET